MNKEIHNESVFKVFDYNLEKNEIVLEEKFINFLKEEEIKKIVVITINGQVGQGKSTFSSFLLNKCKQLESNDKNKMDERCEFEASSGCESFTRGIHCYHRFIQISGIGILLMDMEGLNAVIRGMSSEELNLKLEKLLTISLLMSSVFVYLSPLRIETTDVDALIKVQTNVEMLREKTKIHYPCIYFIVSKTNELKLEDDNTKSGSNKNESSKNITVTKEQQEKILEHLTKKTKLNKHMRENFKSNIFPIIKERHNPKQALKNDNELDNHMYNLVFEFMDYIKTFPGTSDPMTSHDLAEYLKITVEAVNNNEFDLIKYGLDNKINSIKKEINDKIQIELHPQLEFNSKTINDLETLKLENKKKDEVIDEYYKRTLKNTIKKEMEKIKIPEEVKKLKNEFKLKLKKLKNETKIAILKDVFEPRKKDLKKQIEEIENLKKDQSTKIENTQNTIKIETEQYNKLKERFNREANEMEKETKENLDNANKLENEIDKIISQITEMKQSGYYYENNQYNYKELTAEREKLKKKNDDCESEISNLNKAKVKILSELNNFTKLFDEKKTENVEYQENYNKLKTKLNILKIQNKEILDNLADFDENYQVQSENIKDLNKKREDLEDKLNSIEEKIKKLEEEEEILSKSIAENQVLQKENIDITKEEIEKNELLDSKDELAELVESLEEEKKKIEDEIKTYKEKYNYNNYENLKSQLELTQKRYDEIFVGDVDKIYRQNAIEISKNNLELEKLKQEIDEIDDEIKKKKDFILAKPDIIQKRQSVLLEGVRQEEIEKDNIKMSDEFKNKTIEKNKLEERNKELKNQLLASESELEKLTEENKSIEVKLEESKTSYKKESDEIDTELTQLDNEQKNVQEYLNEISSANHPCSKLNEFISRLIPFIDSFETLLCKLKTCENIRNFDNLISTIFENLYRADGLNNFLIENYKEFEIDKNDLIPTFCKALEHLSAYKFDEALDIEEIPKHEFKDNLSFEIATDLETSFGSSGFFDYKP